MRGAAVPLALLLALAACRGGEPPETDQGGGDPTARTDCQALGGTYGRFGLLQEFQCQLPTPDAGKACTASDDCTGFCLAETGTCSPVSPYYGCHAILDGSAEPVTICID